MVADKVVKEHNLLICSNGWLPLIEGNPVPTYLQKDDVIAGGKMGVRFEQARETTAIGRNELPSICFYNTQNFGAIYTDDFIFETAVRNDHKEGSGTCQKTYVMLQCVDNLIQIPLSAKGCVSDLNLAFTGYYSSGKKEDLSAFGVDFFRYVKLRVEAKEGKAHVFINDRLAYTISSRINKAKIVSICYFFQGAGSVDYVKLSNDTVTFNDNFDR
jgi:hypothetical protein